MKRDLGPIAKRPGWILQRADRTLFDESFTSHDSETLLRTLDSVLRRATTLPFIIHPSEPRQSNLIVGLSQLIAFSPACLSNLLSR